MGRGHGKSNSLYYPTLSFICHHFKVILGDFPLSLVVWNVASDRGKVLDLSVLTADYEMLGVKPQYPPTDWFLFTRPFTNLAWRYTIYVFATVVSAVFLSKMMVEGFKTTQSFMILT